MAVMRKTASSWQGCGMAGTLLCPWWECQMVQAFWKALTESIKAKTSHTPGSDNPTHSYLPNRGMY